MRAALDDVREDPALGKPLREELEGLRSMRVGRLRIVYAETRAAVEIVAVGPRRTIYEEVERRRRHDRGET